jgi:hypothetical protein
MAAAAPLIVVAADALLDAMVTVGSALAGSLGLIALAEAIDKNFSKDKSSATKPCDEGATSKPDEPTDLPKPEGIPDNWIEKPSQKGGGKEYINPENPNDRVRVMPGDPSSPNESQRRPYVTDQNGGFRDVNGNPIPGARPGHTREAHIPYDRFKFRR